MTDNTPQQKEGGFFGVANRALARLLKEPHSPYMLGDVKGDFAFDEAMRYQSQWGMPSLMNTVGTFGTRTDFRTTAGDAIDNDAVMACLLWMVRTFTQVPVRMTRLNSDGAPEIISPHPVTELLAHPNPFYAGPMLWRPTLISLKWDGNAYWRKVKNGLGRTIQLFYEPHWTIRPRRTSSADFVSYYEIWRNRQWQRIEVDEIVHFRDGIDPRNDMVGLSDLASALREIATDNEAARFSWTILNNMGVTGPIFSPKTDEAADSWTNASNQLFVQLYQEKSTGDRRGTAMAMNKPADIAWPPTDPAKMNTEKIRNLSARRIASLLGVPLEVVQLGVDKSVWGDPLNSAIRLGYTSNILPTMQLVSNELDIQLLPEFGDRTVEDVVFDTSGIAELQENDKTRSETTNIQYQGGWLLRSEARARHGYPVADDGSDDVYQTPQGPVPAPQSAAKRLVYPGQRKGQLASFVSKQGYTRTQPYVIEGEYCELGEGVSVKMNGHAHTNGRELIKVGEV